MSQNCNLAWVSKWKIWASKDCDRGKFGGKYGMNWIYIKTVVISVNYGFGGGVITVTNAKSSAESEKFTLKFRSESGKWFTNGCHFPPKSTNFGTLYHTPGRAAGPPHVGPASVTVSRRVPVAPSAGVTTPTGRMRRAGPVCDREPAADGTV